MLELWYESEMNLEGQDTVIKSDFKTENVEHLNLLIMTRFRAT